ncbi:hypothetical protein Tco_1561076 [Tanacetum coccineum]
MGDEVEQEEVGGNGNGGNGDRGNEIGGNRDGGNRNGGNGNGENGNGGNGNGVNENGVNENGNGLRRIMAITLEDLCLLETSRTVSVTWWNSHKNDGNEAAYVHELVQKLYGSLMTEELILLCTRMVPNKEDRVERFIRGLPDNIQGNVIAANPARFQDAVRIANQLMDKKLQGLCSRGCWSKSEEMESNSRDNRGQQPPFKRQNISGQNVVRAYTTGNNEEEDVNWLLSRVLLAIERGFLSQKGSGVGRGVKEKQVLMADQIEIISTVSEAHGIRSLASANEENMNDVGTKVGPTPTGNNPCMSSYANDTGVPSRKAWKFRTVFTPTGNGVDVIVPVESIRAISERIFSIQFSSIDGLDAVLENDPWFIRNNPLILKKVEYDCELIKRRCG